MERHHLLIDLDGITYRCHKFTVQAAVAALGPGALMVVDEGGDDERVGFDRSKFQDGSDLMKKVLGVCMISPALGDRDNPDTDTVSWLTLGDHGPALYSAVMAGESKRAADFPESSGDRVDP